MAAAREPAGVRAELRERLSIDAAGSVEPTPADGPDPYGNGSPAWLDRDWSEHVGTADVVGTPVNYVELGAGPAVVLVHGLAGSWQNWLETVEHLSARHRVIALDLPGFGASPKPSWELSMPAYGRLLHDFCERLGVERATFAGSSMGGFVATELATREPDRVEGLVLVSAAGVTWAKARREPAAMVGRMARAARPLMFRYQMAGLRREGLRQMAYRGVFHDPSSLRRELLWEQVVPALNATGFYDALTSLVGYDARERLKEIEVPSLIVWGRNDRVVPVGAAAQYQRLIGDNAATVIFDECGHMPMLERPTRFNRLLDGFLGDLHG